MLYKRRMFYQVKITNILVIWWDQIHQSVTFGDWIGFDRRTNVHSVRVPFAHALTRFARSSFSKRYKFASLTPKLASLVWYKFQHRKGVFRKQTQIQTASYNRTQWFVKNWVELFLFWFGLNYVLKCASNMFQSTSNTNKEIKPTKTTN